MCKAQEQAGLLMICAATIVINLTLTWTATDQATLNRAKIRCSEIYYDAPCLKKLVKKEELVYNAICGGRV